MSQYSITTGRKRFLSDKSRPTAVNAIFRDQIFGNFSLFTQDSKNHVTPQKTFGEKRQAAHMIRVSVTMLGWRQQQAIS